MLLSRSSYRFSTSIDLLVSIAMGSHETFQTQKQLADHFLKQKIIVSPELHESFSHLDRAFFANDSSNPPYGNYAIKLNDVSNMTTPIMHAIPANDIMENMELNEIRVLDVGTGKGYFAQLMNLSLQRRQEYQVDGCDTDNILIGKAIDIQDRVVQELDIKKKVRFQCIDFFTQESFNYNIINIGFHITQQDLYQLLPKLKEPITYIICPILEENSNEQWLSRVRVSNGITDIERIMKCVFQGGMKDDHETPEDTLLRLQRDQSTIEEYVRQWSIQNKISLATINNNTQLMHQLNGLRIIKRKIRFLVNLKN